MADPIVNFFKSTLVGTYSNTDTSFTIATGDGALLPDPSTDGEYNLTIFRGLQVNANTTFEIVRVTAKSGDVLTVTRQQEGTTALTVDSEVHSILMSATKKTFDDIRTDIDNIPQPNQTLNTTDEVQFAGVTVANNFVFPSKTDVVGNVTPVKGQLLYNNDTGELIFYDGSNYQSISFSLAKQALISQSATAQVIVNDAVMPLLKSLGLSTATINANDMTTAFLSGVTRSLGQPTATASANDGVASLLLKIDMLLVGGGGGSLPNGSSNATPGAGAGGFLEISQIAISGAQNFTIGAGGSPGSNGGDTTILGKTALGGGAFHGNQNPKQKSGGSGSGSDSQGIAGGAATQPSSTDGGRGNAGGRGYQYGNFYGNTGGGGGGAGQAGSNAPQYYGGDGGDGYQETLTGTSTYYAGGGGGKGSDNGRQGAGGLGGGGIGGSMQSQGANGTPNTGGGAGGTNYDSFNYKSGGSGVIILKYADTKSATLTNGATTVNSEGEQNIGNGFKYIRLATSGTVELT